MAEPPERDRSKIERHALRRLALRHPHEAMALLEEEYARNGVEVVRVTGIMKDLRVLREIHAKYEGDEGDDE